MPDTQIKIQSEETAIEFIQEQVAIDFVQEQVAIEFVQETTQIDFVSENIVLNLTGVPGPVGPPGADGADGVGVPAGGSTGQVLAKIDGDDFNTEWVDQDGGGGPGGASITDITYADMQTAITGGTLTEGAFYRITDAAGTDLGFVCQAIKTNEITVNGTGGYLNADFQAVGDYSGVDAVTGVTPGTQLGIWRTGFEVITIAYTNLSGGTFAVGDTITGGTTGATAVIITDDGASSMTAYMTSAGVAFDGSEVLDNGDGVTADQNGAAGTPTIVQGDVVIWNLLHYQLTDATLLGGTNPATNAGAYTLLDKATCPETYVTAWDVSEFDFANAWLQYRADLLGNQYYYTKVQDDNGAGFGETAIKFFQWGKTAFNRNKIDNGYVVATNALGSIYNNTIYPGAYINQITFADQSAEIGNNLLFPGSYIYNITLQAGATILTNTMSPAAFIEALTIGSSSTATDNIIENGGSLTGITAGADCSISRNKIGQGATMGGSTTMGDGARIVDLELQASSSVIQNTIGENGFFESFIVGKNAGASTLTLGVGSYVSNSYFYGGIEGFTIPDGMGISQITGNKGLLISSYTTLSESIDLKTVGVGFSNAKQVIDITGLTSLDWGGQSPWMGITELTSGNATESIDTITNPPTLFPFTIRPSAGLALTITGTAYSGISAGQIALKATDYVLDGDKGEYIVLEIDQLGTGCLVEKLVGNGLI